MQENPSYGYFEGSVRPGIAYHFSKSFSNSFEDHDGVPLCGALPFPGFAQDLFPGPPGDGNLKHYLDETYPLDPRHYPNESRLYTEYTWSDGIDVYRTDPLFTLSVVSGGARVSMRPTDLGRRFLDDLRAFAKEEEIELSMRLSLSMTRSARVFLKVVTASTELPVDFATGTVEERGVRWAKESRSPNGAEWYRFDADLVVGYRIFV